MLDTPGSTPMPALDSPPPPRRPAPPGTAEVPRPDRAARVFAVTGVVIVTLLCAVVVGLALRSGAYSPADWLPFLLGVAALGVVIAASGPGMTAGRTQSALLALFGLLALWTVLSLFWATSLGDTWEEINRTLFYAVAIALVFTAVRWAGPLALRVLTGILTAVAVIVALAALVRLATDPSPIDLLPGGRLSYPVSYHNGLACLLMIGFWLALGLANGAATLPRGSSRNPSNLILRVAQPVLLMGAVFLLEFALLPQSRGALWTFFLVIPFFVILSPHRFRALVDLAIVALPVILFWDRINGVYAAVFHKEPVEAAIGSALRAVGYSVLIVLVLWAVTYLVEHFLGPLSRRVRLLVGTLLIVVAIGAAAGGLVYADVRSGGLGDYLGDRWTEFTSDAGTSKADAGTRFAAFGLNGRLTQWKVAAKAFEEHPVLGIGAQNFERYNYQHRTTRLDVRNPHSQPMQVLAELGIVGIVLYAAFMLLALLRAVVLRFRASGRANMAVMAAMVTASLSWFIHSSADWMWQLTAVTLPAILLFAGLVGAGGPGWRRAATAAGAPQAAAGAAAATAEGPEAAAGATGSPAAALTEDAPAASNAAAGFSEAEARQETGAGSSTFAGDFESTPQWERDPLSDLIPRRAARHAAARQPKPRPPWVPRMARWTIVALAALIIVSAALPYLSLRFSAMAAGAGDVALVDSRSNTAAWLDPTAVHPFAARASAYTLAAQQKAEGSPERANDLKRAADAWVDATRRVPDVWLNSYMAAKALLAARDAAAAAGMESDAHYFSESARTFLEHARELNPLSPQVEELEGRL